MPTIGVAVAIPAPYGPWLQQQRADFGDPEAGSIPPHVTLLPPTEVDAKQLQALRGHLREVAARRMPFRMVLRGTGTFRPVSPVVFVMVSRGIAECEQLEQQVRSGPVHRELEFNYHPHVTVAHKIDDVSLDAAYGALAGYVAEFDVMQIDLFEHAEDGNWRAVEAYPLAGVVGVRASTV